MKTKQNKKRVLLDVDNRNSHGSVKKDPLSGKETLDLFILLSRTSDITRKVRQKELAPYGLNRVQAGALQVIHNYGKVRSNDIAREMLRERHSVHELLRRMEKVELIRGTGDVLRKNGIAFELTEKGSKAYLHITERELEHKIFSSLSKKQRAQLKTYLRILYDTALKILE
jgi:DNA-binding MarR family transcriptional regulator